MSDPFVDTDVIIRLLTGDDPEKQEAAAALFEQVERGELHLNAPVTVIADAVYVLQSKRLYARSHQEIADMLSALVRLPAFRVANRRSVLRALSLYATAPVDFGDAFLVASMEGAGADDLYSYDGDFKRFPHVTRRRPGEA